MKGLKMVQQNDTTTIPDESKGQVFFRGFLRYFWTLVFILLTLLAYAQDNSLNASLNFTAAIIYFLFLNKISWNLSNSIRKWIMPEVILTRGAVDAFKQKLFWHIGPQWFSSMTFVLILAFPIEVISPMLFLEG